MSELEATVQYLSRCITTHRRTIFWLVSAALFIALLIAVKEVTTLVLAAYSIAILLDPLLRKLEKYNLSRAFSIVLIGFLLFVAFLLLVLLAIPPLLQQYHQLLIDLPRYIQTVIEKGSQLSQSWLGVSWSGDAKTIVERAKDLVSAVGIEQIKSSALAVGQTVLRGYSFTLTLLNLFLLPFIVFYIGRDLEKFHELLGGFLRPDIQTRVTIVGKQILTHVYAFFEGQLTVAALLAVLYVIGLWLVGLPSALVVGCVSGLLNVVPYLGIACGLVLATVITLVTDPSISQLLLVWGVFVVVQLVEGNFLTPKIVGESVGIHPLGVMLALIVGGQLFGLIGLILAIPAAASIRVLFTYLRSMLEEVEQQDINEVFGKRNTETPIPTE